MKKQDLFKFSLTAMCVAVLSACGSSGGGSLAVENTPTTPSANANANTGAANSAELAAAQKAAQEAAAKQAEAEKAAAAAKAAAEKAAAEKAAAEKAAKEAAEKAAADQAAAVKKAAEEAAKKALADKEAADKAAAEAAKAEADAKKAAEEAEKAALAAANKANAFGNKDKLEDTPYTGGKQSFVGIKHVVKVDSNLATNSSQGKDSTSDIPTPMNVQQPHASLDTIVVAEPLQKEAGAPRVYLEDFDTRFLNSDAFDKEDARKKAQPGMANHGDFGNSAIPKLYIKQDNSTGNTAEKVFDAKQAEREALTKAEANAKTAKDKAVTELNSFNNDLATANTNYTTAKADTAAAKAAAAAAPATATAADVQAKQIAEQVAAQKVTELKAKVAQAEQKRDNTASAHTAAALALSQFNAANPLPPFTSPSAPRTTAADGAGYETKTKTIGQLTGNVWTFSAKDMEMERQHQNFTEKSTDTPDKNVVKRGFVYSGRDLNGNLLVTGYDVADLLRTRTDAGKVVASRNLDKTVAEIYGYRSKASGSFEKPFDVVDNISEPSNGLPANNLPLVNEYNGAKLTNVQYGRVTTALSDKAATEQFYKTGIPLDGSVQTYVASFGEYGDKGTENHYFYRGINNVGSTELTKLKEDTKNGIITYDGHAVTYGLNNNFRGNIPIPTAIGARAGFVSGNHAGVTINLANNKVAGSIYNLWYDSVNSPKDLLPVHLVKFNGTIADNGNIAGTAVREDNKTTGLFGATLYGNGAEIGGTVASDDKGANKWGGVLGGFRTDKATPAEVEYKQAVGTDGGN